MFNEKRNLQNRFYKSFKGKSLKIFAVLLVLGLQIFLPRIKANLELFCFNSFSCFYKRKFVFILF